MTQETSISPRLGFAASPKDEDLLDECDLVVHPLIGTATYFTDAGRTQGTHGISMAMASMWFCIGYL